MKRIISLLLVIITVVSLTSCTKTATENKTDDTVLTDEPVKEIVKTEIDLSAYTEYALVKPYGGTDAELSCATTIFNAVKSVLDSEVNLCTDKKENDDKTLEITVGHAEREYCDTVAEHLRTNDYYIGTSDGGFVIMGGSDTAIEKATEYFVNTYIEIFSKGKITEDDCILVEGEYEVDSVTVCDTELSRYSIVYPENDGNAKDFAEYFKNHIADSYGYKLNIYPDSEKEKKREIIFGKTNRKESFTEEPKAYWYDIKCENSKLVFLCGSLWAYLDAVNTIDLMIKDRKLEITDDTDISVRNSAVKESECNFVYVTSKGLQGETPVKAAFVGDVPLENYTIVYHDYGENYTGYGENEIFAASELQKYIKYATGCELKLIKDSEDKAEYEFIVGATSRNADIDRTDFGDEALYIKSEGNDIILTGGTKRGTLYAVYTFLEYYMGCRFFSSDCEIIYQADEIKIPTDLDVFEKSPYEYRDNSTFSCLSGNVAAKMKYNSCYRRDLDYAHGSSVMFLNGTDGFVHTMSKYLNLGSESSQPCLTSEATYEKAITTIRNTLNGSREEYIISVTQNDNNNPCSCPDCSKVNREEKSKAGTLIRFVNRIADDLKDEYPNVKILTLAYMYSEEPTVTEPRDNVIVELCNFEDCIAHVDGSCSGNSEFKEMLDTWASMTGELYIWNYACDFWGGWEDTPYMNFDTLYYNNKQYAEAGVTGVFHEGRTETFGNEFGELRAYVLGKIMWNPDITLEEYHGYIKEFIRAYYGPISEMVERYFDFLSSASEDSHYDLYSSPASIFDSDAFNKYKDEISVWWQTAGVIEKTNNDTKRHCEALYKGFKFLCEKLDLGE